MYLNLLIILILNILNTESYEYSTPTTLKQTREYKEITSNNKSVSYALAQQGAYSYLRCWRCDYDDTEQCVKNFDFTKHKHEACDGKCLKAFEKTEARTKTEIEKAQLTPTIRKCVSQKELQSLQTLGITIKNGCHDIRTTKRRHKLYCFCENDLCNGSQSIFNLIPSLTVSILTVYIYISLLIN